MQFADDDDEVISKKISPDTKESLKKVAIEYLNEKPKFPTECQVIKERISHVFPKSYPSEPYYVPNGKETHPKIVGEESGSVVYKCDPVKDVAEFSSSDIGGSNILLASCSSSKEDGLRFESRFESGNLAKVIKISPTCYELYLRPDLYTSKHIQWFYFKITNMKRNISYRFTIMNMTKGVSLYSNGMRPLMYSVIDARQRFIGWRRCGSDIAYYPNDDIKDNQNYSLTFATKFPNDHDTVYLAHSYPYTYSDLQAYLLRMLNHPVRSAFIAIKLLCKTMAGNNVYEVTVTSNPYNKVRNKKKKAIVVTARVHPGEAPSSWIMHGILDFLTSSTDAAKDLRQTYVFKLVPMLNPDGVIVGNNRCSLTGRDLNRQYRSVIREINPSIWNTRLMIKRLIQDHGIVFYCDLHAHSNRNNFFMFGCEHRRAVFPIMLRQNAPDKFSLDSCEFKMDEAKEGTGRIAMYSLGVVNSYTLEASIGGTDLEKKGLRHFNTSDYTKMGITLCHTLLDFFDPMKETLRMKMTCMIARGELISSKLLENENSRCGW